MVNGPPTPPPTTEAEIQDEARAAAEDSTSISPSIVASTQPDAFQAIFPAIVALASQSNFRGIIHVAERADLNSDANNDRRMTRLLVLGPLVLAYLIVDDLPPARYALSRLPENVFSTPLSNALFELLASTWDRKYANVYTRAQELYTLVHQPDFFDDQLRSVLAGLTATFVEYFRRRTVHLLSTAYTTLPLELAQVYLGMKQDELLSAAQNEGWSFDPSTNHLVPLAPSSISPELHESSSLASFHFVADSVAKLEL